MNGAEYRQWRLSRGLGHADMARLMATTRRTSERWEDGTQPIPPLVVKLLKVITSRPCVAAWLGVNAVIGGNDGIVRFKA